MLAAKLLCLLLALVALAHEATAACITCNFAPCCPPKYGSPTCVANKCGFTCPKGYFGCGATCFRTPKYVVPACNAKGEYSYKCKKGTQACADLCCPNGPKGSTVTCPLVKGRAKCSFSCPGGFFRCGKKCYFPPPQAIPACKRNKYSFKCTGGNVACGGLCCPPGPAGTKVTCPKNPTSKARYCSFGCPGRALYCGGKCVPYADAKCIPYCENGAVKCNCPGGYKRNAASTGCVKA